MIQQTSTATHLKLIFRTICLTLSLLFPIYMLAGCAESPNEQDQSENLEEVYPAGHETESELVRFTLQDAKFAVVLNNSLPFGADFNINNDYFCPKEYDRDKDSRNPYAASKGNILVWFEFTAENLDRKSIELKDFISVSYDGRKYTANDYVEEQYGWNISDVDGDRHWSSTPVNNVLVLSGQKDLCRGYVELPFEPDNLDDSFDITFSLPETGDSCRNATYRIE